MTDRVAIVGARDASPETLERVREYVRGLPEGTVVISGGASGVDTVAATEAIARGLHVTRFFPNGDGRVRVESDGPPRPFQPIRTGAIGRDTVVRMGARPRDLLLFRNTWIAVACDRMVAFVEGSRGGTHDAIRQARRFRRPVKTIGEPTP